MNVPIESKIVDTVPFGPSSMKDDLMNKKLKAETWMLKINQKTCSHLWCEWIVFIVYPYGLARAI